jgi:YfiH family protein
MNPDWIIPDWPAPNSVRALVTTRNGGVSAGPFASMNLGIHVGDSYDAVAANREQLCKQLPADPFWLDQVHGVDVAVASHAGCATAPVTADASVATAPDAVCIVMTADCLPVLFCDRAGTVVAAAHAGWRGLAAGVLEATVARMGVPAESVLAWLGPAIGPQAFEVGDDVRAAFVADSAGATHAFRPGERPGKWFADLFMLSRQRLARLGIGSVTGGGRCTYTEVDRFFSYRREGVTGRFASMVWLSR